MEPIVVGPYKISMICMQTLPCQHIVTKEGDTETRRLSGEEIVRMLQAEGLAIPGHFAMYDAKDWREQLRRKQGV